VKKIARRAIRDQKKTSQERPEAGVLAGTVAIALTDFSQVKLL
jgi:hypothetical protein